MFMSMIGFDATCVALLHFTKLRHFSINSPFRESNLHKKQVGTLSQLARAARRPSLQASLPPGRKVVLHGRGLCSGSAIKGQALPWFG
jgi:hypothetical protein